ncbi:hypothetical protein AB6A40_005975 [Gnathostoma spinigerum]|uniref:Thioredoxin domain-containing protein n=1 Tax=Gnathostoma spinigerum TaxID=75299 RepID=A0ABD6EHQ8_9BILA
MLIFLFHAGHVIFFHSKFTVLDSDEQKTRDDLKIDFHDLDEKLKKSSSSSEPEDVNKYFMDFRRERERAAHQRSFIFNWKAVGIAFAVGGVALAGLFYLREKRTAELEKQAKIMAGKARIGGPWELVNTDGQIEGSEQLKGRWLLMYFGFTHCPDVCPDSIEKMIEVVDLLEKDPKEKIIVTPIFISVDPERDTIERVKEYCLEFSPKMRGYTGSKEQVAKVAKTFRIYYSQGPKTTPDDYIVDHSVIIYLIDPEGNFHDYYGQNRSVEEICNAIKMKVIKHDLAHRKKFF